MNSNLASEIERGFVPKKRVWAIVYLRGLNIARILSSASPWGSFKAEVVEEAERCEIIPG